MHDAGLERRGGIGDSQGLHHTLQAIRDGDEAVPTATDRQVVKHLQPDLRAFGLLDPNAENVARPIRQAPRIEREPFVVKARQPAGVLGNELRLDRAVPIRGISTAIGPSSVSTRFSLVPLR